MSCSRKPKPAEYKTSVEYVSDGRNAMWHLPFPFLKPSDIGVRLTDLNGLDHCLSTPNEFIAYWDYIVCVVPVGWRISIWLIPPLEEVLRGKAMLPKTKQILDRHMVRAVDQDKYDSESEDGVYIELGSDVIPGDVDSDVPSPELQNDRNVMVEGGDICQITPDDERQAHHHPHHHPHVDPCCHALHYHVHHGSPCFPHPHPWGVCK